MADPAPDRFPDRLRFVLAKEGGFVDHPQDPGGATNHGISLRYARGLGRVVDLDGDGEVTAADIRLVTPAIAAELYRRDFWAAVRGPELPAPLDLVMFDGAVNCGAGAAIRWLQGALGVVVDGAFGPRTLAALRWWEEQESGVAMLVAEVLAQRVALHARLAARQPAMVLGWSRRLGKLGLHAGRELPL